MFGSYIRQIPAATLVFADALMQFSSPLIDELARRRKPPALIRRRRRWTFRLAGERDSMPPVEAADARQWRAQLRRDGVDRALVALSSALGIETLPGGEEAAPLLAAYHRGVERLVLGRPTRPAIARTARGGSAFSFAASDIHRVLHAGSELAVTIHAYSPPLVRMGAYVIEPSGQLQRACGLVRRGAALARGGW